MYKFVSFFFLLLLSSVSPLQTEDMFYINLVVWWVYSVGWPRQVHPAGCPMCTSDEYVRCCWCWLESCPSLCRSCLLFPSWHWDWTIAESGRLKPLTVKELCCSAQPCHVVPYISWFCSGLIYVYYYYVILMDLFFYDSFSCFMANFDLKSTGLMLVELI